MRRFSRRKLLIGGGAALAAGVTAGYAWLIEPTRIVLERVTLSLSRLPEAFDGLTIAQISDVHHSRHVGLDHIREAVALCQREQPDIVVLTGDYVSLPRGGASAAFAEPCAEALSPLRGKLGSFAILGNHDHYIAPARVASAFRSAGFAVLVNQAAPLEKDGQRLWICGVDDALVGLTDFARASAPAGEVALLLAHEPDIAEEAARHGFILQLSGHSHGGQVRLPFFGAPVLPPLGKRYPAGRYQIGPMQLYTNRGVGLIAPAVRFNCPPEITLLTLRSVRA